LEGFKKGDTTKASEKNPFKEKGEENNR